MNFTFSGCRVSGLLTVVPVNERCFMDEMASFNAPPARSLKLKEVMGYDRHRIVDGPVCVSDLACHGMEYLFRESLLSREDFDALVLVTQCPDHFMPPTSSVIQGRLGLKQDLFCMDINQGCAGFVIGLIQGFLLLSQPSVRRVVLINADVVSRKVSEKDRNSYPLIGDAASIAVLERSEIATPIHANLKMDGSRCEVLKIPAGGFRLPASSKTEALEEDGEGNQRAKNHLCMDGTAVFNFVQVEVPPMIERLLQAAGAEVTDIDYFFFHQPNRFMLQKLADKMKIPYEKMPMNVVEHYGNSSGVTIPMAITHNHRQELRGVTYNTCVAGFGVGLTWGSMLMPLGPLSFCDIIEYE